VEHEEVGVRTADCDAVHKPVTSLTFRKLGTHDVGVDHGQRVSPSQRSGRVARGDRDSWGGSDLCINTLVKGIAEDQEGNSRSLVNAWPG